MSKSATANPPSARSLVFCSTQPCSRRASDVVLVPVSFSGGTSEVAVDSGARDGRVRQVREVEGRSKGGAGRKLQPSSLCNDSNWRTAHLASRASVSATVQQSNGAVATPLNVTSLLSGMGSTGLNWCISAATTTPVMRALRTRARQKLVRKRNVSRMRERVAGGERRPRYSTCG